MTIVNWWRLDIDGGGGGFVCAHVCMYVCVCVSFYMSDEGEGTTQSTHNARLTISLASSTTAETYGWFNLKNDSPIFNKKSRTYGTFEISQIFANNFPYPIPLWLLNFPYSIPPPAPQLRS